MTSPPAGTTAQPRGNILPPPIEQMLQRTLQPGEAVELCSLTNIDEALIVTSARVIILKGPSRTTAGVPPGRFFPLTELNGITSRGFLLPKFVAVLTQQTRNETVPDPLWACSFGVTFASGWVGWKCVDSLRGVVARAEAVKLAQTRRTLLTGPLCAIRPTGNIAVQAGEEFYYECPSTAWAEHSYTQFVGGSQGISFPIFRGIRGRVGGFRGHSVRKAVAEPDDHGVLLVGNRRVLFVGSRKTIAINNSQIGNVDVYTNAVMVGVANKPTMRFDVPSEIPGLLLKRVLNIP